ncbi:MAG TPA: HlyD family efflux transporter periplasmic adaptor subunit [Rhodanobacteraceae bacterium]|nr:HlyD family efflux transporter periplasmic adaptor subunit [Rhodanobacteraceae bacterium]
MSSPATEPTEPTASNGKRRRVLGVLAIVMLVIGLGWWLLWTLVLSQREVTEDAYVGGSQVTISAQVPGTVIAVLTDNTRRVQAGQTLVELDPTDADVMLAKARSALAQSVRQVRQQRANASQFDAAIATRKLDLARAEADVKRRAPLLAQHAVAPEELAHARAALDAARAALKLVQSQAAAARAPIAGVDVAHNPQVLAARAAFREAWVNAHRNAVLSPIDGYVAQRSVEVGQRIQPGQPLMQVVPLDAVHIDANFKEVQLQHIRIGQPVEVKTDLYGSDVVFHGHVAGLAAGTGGAFALLPPQNASGNWIKVVQRVPVRIELDAADLVKHPLRIGLSSEVTVDISHREGAVLAASNPDAPVDRTTVYDSELAAADHEADAIIAANLASAD